MFNFESKELEQYVQNLQNTSRTAFPKTVRSTLDRMAFLGRKEYLKNIKKNFVIRNAKSNIILKSVRHEKCPGTLDINKMVSITGQGETTFGKKTEQLRKQEFGEYIHAKKHIMKPQKTARGGSYKRAVKSQYLLSQIKLSRIEDLVKNPAKTEFRQFRQAIGYAKHNPGKPFYLLTNENYWGIRGIAEIDGNNGDKSAKYLYSLKDKTQKLNRVSVLEPVGVDIGKQGQSIFAHEAQRRIMKELSRGLK